MADIPSPIQVAEQQLDTAIELFFMEGSPVAIHTLACAALEVLDKLCEKQGLERSVVEESLSKRIPREKRKLVHDGIFAMRNYFKHGALSRGVEPKWNPDLSIYFLVDACSLYRRLTDNNFTKNTLIFGIWFRMLNPDMFEPNQSFDSLLSDLKQSLSGLNKKEFYRLSLQASELSSLSSTV